MERIYHANSIKSVREREREKNKKKKKKKYSTSTYSSKYYWWMRYKKLYLQNLSNNKYLNQ